MANGANGISCLDLLDQLNLMDEHRQVEAKRASDIGLSLMETICGFANEPGLGGGYLLLGVHKDQSDFSTQYEVDGISDPDRLQANLATQCANMFNVVIRPQIWVEHLDGKAVVGVFVQEAQPSEKPIYIQKRGLPQGAYRRIGSTDQRCNEDDLQALYEGRTFQTYDRTMLQDSSMEDLDSDVIQDYRRLRRDGSALAEELEWSDEDLMIALGCAVRSAEHVRATIAGVLLFGTGIALRRYFPMMRLDYIRIPGKSWIADPDHRFDTLDMRGPILRLVARAHSAVLDDLPKTFTLPQGELHRRDVPLIPDRVVREALVNALMHRNYRIQSPIQVIRYSNRLEISNPGYSLKPQESLGEPGSQTRNPVIAAVLHETNLAETKGSGIRAMRQFMDGANLTPPTFQSNREQDRFISTFLFHHFLSEEDVLWLARFQNLNLTDDEARALIFVREAGRINNADYRNITQLDTLTVSSRLRRLRDAGLLFQQGKGSATYYLPTVFLDPELKPDFLDSAAQFTGVIEQSSGLDEQSSGLDKQSSGLDKQSSGLDRFPSELRERLGHLKQRVPPGLIRGLILEICALEPTRAEDLAEVLCRGKGYLIQNYLSPMVKQGALDYLFPESHAHPQQAYKTPGLKG